MAELSLPWHTGPHYKTDVMDKYGRRMAEASPFMTAVGEERAEFIVRAVNSHDELLAALGHAVKRDHGFTEWCDGCRLGPELLAKAEAK